MSDETENGFLRRGITGRYDRRTFLKAGAMLAGTVALGLPACAPQAAKQLFEAKVGISGVSLQNSPYFIAENKGFLAEEGLASAWTEFAGGGDTIRALTSGGFQYGIAAWGAAATAFEQGEPIRIIADGWHDTDNCWVARIDSPLNSIKDIKGKKVAYSRAGSNTHMLLLGSLRGAGIDPGDVQLVATGTPADTWTAVKTGVIDVGFSLEPMVSQVVGDKEAKVLWWVRDYIPEWSSTPLVANADFGKQNPEVLKGYIRAYMKGLDFCKSSPAEAGKVFAGTISVTPELTTMAYKNTPPRAFDVKVSKTFLDYLDSLMLEFKQVKAKPDWKTLFDQSYLPDSLKSPL